MKNVMQNDSKCYSRLLAIFALTICVSGSSVLAQEEGEGGDSGSGAQPVADTSKQAQQDSWEFAPYRVQIWIAYDRSPVWSASIRRRLERELLQQCEVYAEVAWQAKCSEAPAGIQTKLAYRGGVTVDDLIALEDSEDAAVMRLNEKTFLVGLQDNHQSGFNVNVKELDGPTRTWSQEYNGEFRHIGNLSNEVFEGIEYCFSPAVRITYSKGKDATGLVRGAGILLRDDSPCRINQGDVLRPIVRRNDRDGEPKKINGIVELPWTYMYVRKAIKYDIDCRMYSSLANPISGKRSSRTIPYALVVKPYAEQTDVLLRAMRPELKEGEKEEDRPPAKILEGYHLYSREPMLEEPSDPRLLPKPEHLGQTDWNGSFKVKRGKHKMRVLYIRNGQQVLARLPVVPGYTPTLISELPDDDQRLQAESFVTGIQQGIMDVVIQQKVFEAQMEYFAENKDKEGIKKRATTMISDVRSLPTRDDFSAQLIEKSRQLNLDSMDKRTRQKVERLFSRTNKILDKFVDPDIVTKMEEAYRNGFGSLE